MSLSSEYEFEFELKKKGPHETAVTHPSTSNPGRPGLTLEDTRRKMNKDVLFCLPLLLLSVCMSVWLIRHTVLMFFRNSSSATR